MLSASLFLPCATDVRPRRAYGGDPHVITDEVVLPIEEEGPDARI